MKTLYVSDLDGTLLDRQARLSVQSETIIRRCIEEGMLFTVATARSQSAIGYLQQLGVRIPSIHLNGVLLYDYSRRQYIDCVPMDIATSLEIIRILKDFDRMSFVYKFDSDCGINVEFERLSNEVERNFFEARKNQDYKSFRQTPEITVSEEDKVIYFTMVDTYERLHPIYTEIQKLSGAKATLYSDNYSSMYFLEVFSSAATKAAGVLKLKKMLGADRIVAFGDNLNDLEMMKIADCGIAVGDAVESVRQQADAVIGRSYEDGVALYLMHNS
ncbi:MAG: HAD-IIB family hydrolase [Acutalibacteraceae bacterium]|nr:HAD-IIB family hydrolase [Acutalibacteraceae bacterium]HCA53935.1 Cof-type HAD-IIB family hydrolase [Oscillospiraceae bacterium]